MKSAIDRDLFYDERQWALSRTRWKITRWWRQHRLSVLLIVSIILVGVVIYYDEHQRRLKAESEAVYVAMHSLALSCYTKEQPASIILAAGSKRDLYEALRQAGDYASHVRLSWLIAKEQANGK